jgi:hypothetical protein
MTITHLRRIVAATVTAGLVLVAAPTLSPASAADACALGATCQGALEGTLGASPFTIQMPQKFNGTVLIWSHGYRFSGPIPAAFAGPTALNLSANPVFQKISVPAFAASFGTDVAYQASNVAETSPDPAVAQALLAQGFALAGAGYARQGWAAAEGVQAGENLMKYIRGGGIKGVRNVRAWGASLGGLITQTLLERNPGKIQSAMPVCGAFSGPESLWSPAMTLLYSWKTLVAPTLKVANYTPGPVGYAEALTDLGTVFTILGKVGAGALSNSPLGYPIAQANMLGGLMGGLPTKSAVYDGVTVNPAFGTLGTAAALAGGFAPASAGASSAAGMLQNTGVAAALGILGRYDLEMRLRVMAQIPDNESANFNDNVNVSYTNLLSPEQRGEFGDTLNSTTAMPNALNAMLAALDASQGNPAVRFPANPKAVAALNSLPAPKGAYSGPEVLMSTTYDPAVPAGNTGWLSSRLRASFTKGGGSPAGYRVATFYTVPPADGWTQFAPGAKSPSAALSVAALGGSGVGHCVFTGAQILGGVGTWSKVTNATNALRMRAATRGFWQVPGVNNDGGWVPDALKRPGGLPKPMPISAPTVSVSLPMTGAGKGVSSVARP